MYTNSITGADVHPCGFTSAVSTREDPHSRIKLFAAQASATCMHKGRIAVRDELKRRAVWAHPK
jgi:hypothetical protein